MPFADLADIRLHYRFDGAPSAPVLVLSNSLGTDLRMWEPQMDALAQRFRVLRYDTRGHGQSGVAPGPYAIEGLARDVLALTEHLQIAQFDFCGLSMGGITGMWLGVHAPTGVRRMVLANTAARIAPPELWNARIEKVATSGMASISDAVLARWFTGPFLAREAATVAMMKAMIEATPAAGYIACCAAVRDIDQRDDVARIAAPTMVIAGTQDLATPPADSAFLAERIAGTRLVQLDAGHLSNIEQAPAFTAALLAHCTA